MPIKKKEGTDVKFINVSTMREQCSKVLHEVNEDAPCVVMNFGKPTAVVIGVEGMEIGEVMEAVKRLVGKK